MRPRTNWAAAPVLALAFASALTGCSDFPEGDANPATVRVYLDRDFDQTWQLAACDTANEASLSVTGTNTLGGRIVIDISDGTGNVTVFSDATTIGLTGSIEEYEIDEEQLFTAKGEYRSGEDGGKIELEGNCSPA